MCTVEPSVTLFHVINIHTGTLLQLLPGANLLNRPGWIGLECFPNFQLDKNEKSANTLEQENELFSSNAFECMVSDLFADYFVVGA